MAQVESVRGPVIEVVDGPDALARRGAGLFAKWAAEAVAANGRFSVALSGGQTPKALYEGLRDEYGQKIDWRRVFFYFGDERCVPPDHPDSNFRMARQSLLKDLTLDPAQIRRIEGERPAEEAAQRYEALLLEDFSLRPRERPRFDLALMGLGTDGHTASLFPGSEVLQERIRLVRGGWMAAVKANRVTLTLPVFNAAARVLFIAAGPAKAELARKAIEGAQPPVPAGLVRPQEGELHWLLDEAAASKLSSRRASGSG